MSSRKLMLALGAFVGFLLLAGILALAGVDAGLFDRPVQAIASAKAHRAVRFSRLRTHLLSRNPAIEVEGLVIASPREITTQPLLRAPLLTAHVRWAGLLLGRFELVDITLTRPQLDLVRLRPGVTNASFPQSGETGFLRSTRRLTIIAGSALVEDLPRRLTLRCVFSQVDRPGEAMSFRLAGSGVIEDGAFTVAVRGADVNGRLPSAPYPFSADIRDGAVAVELDGASGRPFDFKRLDLAARASGPNLTSLGYLFGFHAPNSAPFQLVAKVRREGSRV
ncbi:MAG: hypothetical protein JO111_08440, partial [Caulobacteraceae bacterium]|nr:hypothetical protein [Caulobacteraceae bacterium]